MHTHTHTHTHHTHTLSLSHTHTHTHIHTHTYTHTHTHSHVHSHKRNRWIRNTEHTHTHTYTYTHTLSLSLSHTHTHSYAHTHKHTQAEEVNTKFKCLNVLTIVMAAMQGLIHSVVQGVFTYIYVSCYVLHVLCALVSASISINASEVTTSHSCLCSQKNTHHELTRLSTLLFQDRGQLQAKRSCLLHGREQHCIERLE